MGTRRNTAPLTFEQISYNMNTISNKCRWLCLIIEEIYNLLFVEVSTMCGLQLFTAYQIDLQSNELPKTVERIKNRNLDQTLGPKVYCVSSWNSDQK